MYEKLETYGKNSNLKEDFGKYPCSNCMYLQRQKISLIIYNLPSSQNTNLNQLPFFKVNEQEKNSSSSNTITKI